MKKMLKISFYGMITFVFLWGCQKQKKPDDIPKTEQSARLNMLEAQRWYEQEYGKLNTGETGKLPQLKFTPDWNNAVITEDENYYIVESPVQSEKSSGFRIRSQDGTSEMPVNGDRKLLVLKSKASGVITAMIMSSGSGNGVIQKDWHYLNPGNNFSGVVLYTDMGNNFSNGWRYENGKVTGKITQSGKTKAANSKIAPPPEDCEIIYLDTYERDCYYAYGELLYCTDWVHVGTIEINTCSGTGGGGVNVSNFVDCTKCANDFVDLYSNSETTSDEVSYQVSNIDPLTKFKNPRWRILKNLTWALYSQESGIIELVDPVARIWNWKSLTHNSISFVGISIGGDITYDQGFGTPSFTPGTPNVQYAGMSVSFNVTYSPGCKQCPVDKILKPVTIPYVSNGFFSAN